MRAGFALLFLLFSFPVAGAPSEFMTADGVAPLRIGMTEAEAKKILGTKFGVSSDASGNADACEDAGVSDQPGIYIMLVRHRIAVFETSSDDAIRTADGIRIGTREDELRKIFGERAIFTDRPYFEGDPDYHRVIVKLGGNREFVFSTDKGVVDSLSVGDLPGVEAMEGCA